MTAGRGLVTSRHSRLMPDYPGDMLTVEVTETISCTPDELLKFVMDIERYAQVDHKIRPVRWARYDVNLTEFGFQPRLGGLPAPLSVAQMRLTPVSALTSRWHRRRLTG